MTEKQLPVIAGPFLHRWPDRTSGPYALRFYVGMVDGRPAVVGVELYGDRVRVRDDASPDKSKATFPGIMLGESPVAITTTELRKLLTGEMLDEWKQWHRTQLEGWLATHPGEQESPIAKALTRIVEGTEAGRHRRPTYGREHFEQVAEVYITALSDGYPPTAAVTDTYKVNKSTAAKWVAKCRVLKLLSPTTKGKISNEGIKS